MSSARVVRRVLVLAMVVAFVLVCPVSIRASEKIFQSYRLEVTNRGGHSSLPVKDNAIWHLVGGLVRLGDFDFPVNLDEVNRQFFERSAAQIGGSLGNDIGAVVRGERDRAVVARVAAVGPVFNSRLHTTCVPTRLEGGGYADNALPQTAHAVVNCRVLPTREGAFVQAVTNNDAGRRALTLPGVDCVRGRVGSYSRSSGSRFGPTVCMVSNPFSTMSQ